MSAAPDPLPDDQWRSDPQCVSVAGQDPSSPNEAPIPKWVTGTVPPTESTVVASPKTDPSRLADDLLLIYADALDDLERVRIATQNRVRSLRQVKGMADSPEESRLASLVDGLAALEHGAELELARALRKHPLGPWVKRTIGIGEKQGARLLAAIGDPADRKTVSRLWAYCGYHVLNAGHPRSDAHTPNAGVQVLHPGHLPIEAHADNAGVDPSTDPGHRGRGTHPVPAGVRSFGHTTDHGLDETHVTAVGGVAPSHKRGQQANWNDTARMRAYLVAESCMKNRRSPYRAVYDNGREKYADSVHAVECRRCGPSGKPALVGSPLSDGHKHARALRLVAKAVLRDLWVEARRLRQDGAA